MIQFKKGVSLKGVTEECITAMSVAAEFYSLFLDMDAVITSVNDGRHMKGSKHYEGNAFDLRTWTTETSGVQMSELSKKNIVDWMYDKLGIDYDIVVESDHIHVEYDPE